MKKKQANYNELTTHNPIVLSLLSLVVIVVVFLFPCLLYCSPVWVVVVTFHLDGDT